MKTVFLILGIIVLLSGCSSVPRYQRYSSGQIGCPACEIEISDIKSGMFDKSWVARCRGKTFYCNFVAGDGTVISCKEELK